jgi:ubiquinone/menaquinone biosynthesis C-methylase UbiE
VVERRACAAAAAQRPYVISHGAPSWLHRHGRRDTLGQMPKLPLLACALLSLVCSAPVATGPSSRPATTQAAYEYRPRSRDGIGKFYMGLEIAHFMSHRGADWLERPQREEEEKPQALVDAMELKPADVVADIGAGTGYFSYRLAPKVPQGKVLAVDIQPEMLERLTAAAKQRGVSNVEPVLGTTSDPKLPKGGVDVVLMVDAYHEFDQPREMMEAVVASLKPGGRVVLVEYRAEDPQVRIKPLHKMTEAQAVTEMRAAGLRHVETKGLLPQQHLMIFQKPPR